MAEPGVPDLMSVRQVIDVIDAAPVLPRVERRSLLVCQGYRLAEDVLADRDYPPFDKSLMDGYAVRLADLRAAPAELAVVGELPAGQVSDRPLQPGETVAIMTGAPLPPGADGVVPVEEVELLGDRIRFPRPVAADRYIARRGSDVVKGHIVLPRGTVLEAAQLAVAASVGAAEVAVFDKPRVAVLGTGDELVPIDQEPGPAQIRDSNNVMLVALLRRLGCEVTDLGIARDEPEAIRDALASGLDGRFDALFVTGGMSMGTRDYVPRTLIDLGVDLKVTKLRIKPGKPFVFGTRKSAETDASGSSSLSTSFVFGLPGNPVSAFVCTLRLASRLLARIGGGAVRERWLTGRIDAGLLANGPREFYQPAVRSFPPGAKSSQAGFATITPLAWKGSADVYTLAAANVFIVRGENEPPLPKGTIIRALEI